MVSEDWQGTNVKGGQNIIRDNIFNFQGSSAPAALGRIIDQSRPPLNNWQGRVEELKLLQDWTQRSHEIQVIGLIAAGGYGKSALAAKFCETVEGFTKVIWSTFSKMYSFALWGRWLLEQIGVRIDEKVTDEDLVILVSNRLAKDRYLVVIDNLETLIEKGGQWKDNAYQNFLVRWTGTSSSSVVLITSREQPSLPDSALNRSIWKPLGGLSNREGADLLQALHVQGETAELESFVQQIDGHPLLIDLSVGALKKIAGDRPSINELNRSNLNLLEIVGQHRGNPEISVAKILTASFERLPSHLQDLLLNLSIYRLPFDWQAARFMVTEEIETTEASITEDLRTLSRLAWLIAERSDAIWIFRFQPLVQNYLQERLEDKTKAHERAIDYYQSIAKTFARVLEDATPQLEIFHHYCELKQYSQADKILYSINNFLNLGGYFLKNLELHHQLITNWEPIVIDENIYDLAWAWLRLGNCQYLLDKYQKAFNSYQKSQNLLRKINDQDNEAGLLMSLGNLKKARGSLSEAIKLYKQSLEIYQNIGTRRDKAVPLFNLGSAYNSLGQYQQAIELYDQSLEIYQDIGDREGEASSLGGLGSAYYSLGQYSQAIELYDQSLEICQDIGDRRGEASSLGGLGSVYYSLGQYQQAIELYDQSLEICQDIGDRRGEAFSLGGLGSAYHSLGQYSQAIELYDQSLEICQDIGDRSGVAYSLSGLGNTYNYLGQYQQAIELYEQSLEISRQIGDRGGVADSLGGLGSAYNSLGQYQQAIDLHDQSLEIYQDIGNRRGEANSLGGLGSAYNSLGQYQQAIELYDQSLEICQDIGDRSGEAISLGNLGNVYNSLGQYSQAIDLYQQSLEIKRQIGDRSGEAISLSGLGSAYNSLGQYQQAIELYQQSLEIFRQIGDRSGEASSLIGLGNAYNSLGQYQQGIELYEQSLEIFRQIGDRDGEALCLWNLANAYQSRGRIRKGLEYKIAAVKIWQSLQMPIEAIPMPNYVKRMYKYYEEEDGDWAELYIQSQERMGWLMVIFASIVFLVFLPIRLFRQYKKSFGFWFLVGLAIVGVWWWLL